jgi:hypothetical protein
MGPGGKDGFAIFYSYREPPHNPGRQLFLLVYRKQGLGSEEPISGGVPIQYCPWCGSDLAAFPRAPNKSPKP